MKNTTLSKYKRSIMYDIRCNWNGVVDWFGFGRFGKHCPYKNHTVRHNNGQIQYTSTTKYGKLHSRDGKPSKYLYDVEGRLICISYHKKGKLHRRIKPAVIFTKGHSIQLEEFWTKGKKINYIRYYLN